MDKRKIERVIRAARAIDDAFPVCPRLDSGELAALVQLRDALYNLDSRPVVKGKDAR